jgi:S-DNA-T family DNA segregation ATPase FtsK/SpoIIIE
LDRLGPTRHGLVRATAAEAEPLVLAARRNPRLVVVVDDAHGLAGLPAEAVLADLVGQAHGSKGSVVCGADSSVLAGQYRGVARHLAQYRAGLLLGPETSTEGDLFGLRVHADPAAPPGRGHLIVRGRATPVQVALPGSMS